MNIKKIAYIVLGYIGVALGAVGAIVPLLPAFPFLLLATFCFAKSSEKLHNWFISTKLYKNTGLYRYKKTETHDVFLFCTRYDGIFLLFSQQGLSAPLPHPRPPSTH